MGAVPRCVDRPQVTGEPPPFSVSDGGGTGRSSADPWARLRSRSERRRTRSAPRFGRQRVAVRVERRRRVGLIGAGDQPAVGARRERRVRLVGAHGVRVREIAGSRARRCRARLLHAEIRTGHGAGAAPGRHEKRADQRGRGSFDARLRQSCGGRARGRSRNGAARRRRCDGVNFWARTCPRSATGR